MKKLQRNKILSVGLIGLGKIGMGLDLEDTLSENVFKSHLKSTVLTELMSPSGGK